MGAIRAVVMSLLIVNKGLEETLTQARLVEPFS